MGLRGAEYLDLGGPRNREPGRLVSGLLDPRGEA